MSLRPTACERVLQLNGASAAFILTYWLMHSDTPTCSCIHSYAVVSVLQAMMDGSLTCSQLVESYLQVRPISMVSVALLQSTDDK